MNERGMKVKIDLDEETAQGIYSNLCFIRHNETEFVIDFIYVQPHESKAKVRARIICSPGHTKQLLLALKENVDKYEKKFGVVKSKASGPE